MTNMYTILVIFRLTYYFPIVKSIDQKQNYMRKLDNTLDLVFDLLQNKIARSRKFEIVVLKCTFLWTILKHLFLTNNIIKTLHQTICT